ncbi:DUF6264 family protein [Microbacterium sp.]|uniref:DUF6264 family protein n=1 Tax=Microbacterium sp. TaxID=51671 RepID=UPI0039E30BCD
MSDNLPRYGELATPEEQRRAAGLPSVQIAPALVSSEPLTTETTDAAQTAPRKRPVDRLVTIVLLAYGLVNVIATGLSYLDLPGVMNEVMGVLGIEGEFTNYAQGRLWGTVAAVVLVLGWTLTAALAIRRLRRGRLTWWVPVVGAVITSVVTGVILTVPMLGDPAFVAYLAGGGR